MRGHNDIGATEGDAAWRYIRACDYGANADYHLFAQEVMAIAPVPVRTIVEIGSGPGSLAALLRSCFPLACIWGFDASRTMIKYASMRYRGFATFVQAFSDSIPLPPNSVDLLVSFNTLHQIEELRPTLSEVLRVLRPAGCAYLSDLDRETTRLAVRKKLIRMHPDVKGDFIDSMTSAFTRFEVAEELRAIGCHAFNIRLANDVLHDMRAIPLDPYRHDLDLALYFRVLIHKWPC